MRANTAGYLEDSTDPKRPENPLFQASPLTYSHQSLLLFPHGFAEYMTNLITKFLKIWKNKTSLIAHLFSMYLGFAQTSKKALILRGGISGGG